MSIDERDAKARTTVSDSKVEGPSIGNYARILTLEHEGLGDRPLGEASRWERVRHAIEAEGHALQRISLSGEADTIDRMVRMALDVFRPTIVLIDAESMTFDYARHIELVRSLTAIPVCIFFSNERVANSQAEAARRCDHLVTDGLWDGDGACHELEVASSERPSLCITCAPDTAYALGAAVRDDEHRKGALLMTDPACDAYARLSDGLAEVCGRSTILVSPTSHEIKGMGPEEGTSLAFLGRTTKYCVIDPACYAFSSSSLTVDIASRIAEGNLVLLVQDTTRTDHEAPGTESSASKVRAALTSLFATLPCLPSDDIAREIRRLEEDAARYEELLESQRESLVALGSLELGIRELLRLIQSREVAQGHRDPLSLAKPAERVVAYGWQGAHNFGDDLLLHVLMHQLSLNRPKAYVDVIGWNPQVLREESGVEATSPWEKPEVERMLSGASCLVYLGGLFFDGPMQWAAGAREFCLEPDITPPGAAACALLAHAYDVPCVGLGIGLGPLDRRVTRQMVKLIGAAGTRFLVRDEHSADLLAKSGVPAAQVEICADIAFSARDYILGMARDAQSGIPGLPEDGYFVVSMRDWPLCDDGFVQRTADYVDRIVERTGLPAVFLPFDAQDISIHGRIHGAMRNQDKVVLIESQPSENEILACVAGSRLAFAMRLHCLITHLLLGKPALALNYNDKIGSLFHEVGLSRFLLELNEDTPHGREVVDRFLSELGGEALAAELLECMSERTGKAMSAFEHLYATLDAQASATRLAPDQTGGQEFFYRDVSMAELRLREERAERAREVEELRHSLEAERQSFEARLEKQAHEIRSSHSYRLGNLLMRPLSVLKRILGRHG